jgi:hypothetical protein
MNIKQDIKPKIEFGNLKDYLIDKQIEQGYTKLNVLSGFSSGAILRQLLFEHRNLCINLIIGMAGSSGIPCPDHAVYMKILKQLKARFDGYYYSLKPGVHAKFIFGVVKIYPQLDLLALLIFPNQDYHIS